MCARSEMPGIELLSYCRIGAALTLPSMREERRDAHRPCRHVPRWRGPRRRSRAKKVVHARPHALIRVRGLGASSAGAGMRGVRNEFRV